MREPVDELLDAFAARSEGLLQEPPPTFLRAVARRRRRRRLSRAGTGVALLIVVVGAATALRLPGSASTPAPREPISESSLIALVRANAGRGIEQLILPEGRGASGDRPLQLGLRWDPAAVERWVGQ